MGHYLSILQKLGDLHHILSEIEFSKNPNFVKKNHLKFLEDFGTYYRNLSIEFTQFLKILIPRMHLKFGQLKIFGVL